MVQVKSSRGTSRYFNVSRLQVRETLEKTGPWKTKPELDSRPGVLVVEDNPAVRMVCRRLLEKAGYRVFAAADGLEGLRELESSAPHIDLVISDMVMPNLGGLELAQIVGERFPDVKVVLSSGHPEESARAAAFDREKFICKPFHQEALLSLVEQTLTRVRQTA